MMHDEAVAEDCAFDTPAERFMFQLQQNDRDSSPNGTVSSESRLDYRSRFPAHIIGLFLGEDGGNLAPSLSLKKIRRVQSVPAQYSKVGRAVTGQQQRWDDKVHEWYGEPTQKVAIARSHSMNTHLDPEKLDALISSFVAAEISGSHGA